MGEETTVARRSTRERKKPKPMYEVEDRRRDENEDAGESADAGGEGEPREDEKGDDEEVEDEEEEGEEEEDDDAQDAEEEEEAFELEEPKSGSKMTTPVKRGRASQSAKKAAVKPRKLKPVLEEPRPRKTKPAKNGDGDEEGKEDGGGDDDDDDDMFFEAVKRGKCSMTELVADWRERFEENAELATREVLNFLLQSCGGLGVCVPASTPLEKLDMSDLVDYVVGDLEKTNSGYPVASRVKAFKKFQSNFVDFWDAFVKECYESELMFTTQIIDQYVDWLTTLSSAEVRAVRHTSAIAAYAVGNALVDCTDKLAQQLSVVQRQLKAETASANAAAKKTEKSPPKKATSKKLEQLKLNKAMYEERKNKLLELVQLLFHGVVVHRYRDVMPEIRAESVSVLGNWITVVPSVFLKDNYLKYLGWVLNDKDASVRLEVVQVLLKLYENESNAQKLEQFTGRFLTRFLELCNDVDDAVVEACIRLLIAIDKRSLISSDVELHSVERLVFDENNEVIRKAAAEFVCLQYDAFGVAESNRKAKLTKDQLNTQAIALVEFAEEYITNHNVPAEAVETMVDAFWALDDCLVLQNWKLQIGLLLADKNAPDLTSEQQTLLIRLLLASIGKITADDGEKSNTPAKKKQAKEKEELCVTICKEIPTMLVRFQSDVEKLSLLVDLIPLLTLNGEISGIQPTNIKSLLEKLQHAYTAHSEVSLLKSLSLSIHHLHQSEHEVIKRESEVVIHELVQDVLDKLDECLEEDEKLSLEATESADKARGKKRLSKKKTIADSEFAVQTALTRIECLSTHVCIRDFTHQALTKRRSASPGGRRKSRDSVGPESSRMEKITTSLVSFIHRRTNNATELDSALLKGDSIKSALTILFSDVLWLTRPVFMALANNDNLEDAAASSGDIIEKVEQVRMSRAQLEDAIRAVLEMHLKKVKKLRGPEEDETEASDDFQIGMEEISLDDPKVALFVREAQRAAFMTFCDARSLFVEKFKDYPPPYDGLDWPPSKILALLTQMYFESEMEADQPEDEENAEGDDDQKIERAMFENNKAEVLAALGRVSQSNPSNKRQAASVLRFLVEDHQEVVRAFSKHVKAETPVRFLEVQMTALRQVFSTILELKDDLLSAMENGASQKEQDDLESSIAITEAEAKELAKKLSQSLGVGKIAASLRAPFFRFLCEGVRYALEQPSQFTFLEVLRPYLSHLEKQSTKQLNAYFVQLLEDLGEDVPAEGENISLEWRTAFEFQLLISNPDGVVKSTATKLKRKAKASVASSLGAGADDDARSQFDADEETEAPDAQGPQTRKRRLSAPDDTPKKRGRMSKAGSNEASPEETINTPSPSRVTQRKAPAKRKLMDDEEAETPSKKSRATRSQPRRASSGRITQLSDDEDGNGSGQEEGDAEVEAEVVADADVHVGDAEGEENKDAEEVEEEETKQEGSDDEEIDSRRGRRRGRGRK